MPETVGIFDSGLGGLTAACEFERLFPHKRYIYFGDTARVPYGSKSAETIRRYALQDANFLLSRGASLIITACGTVSANAIDALRESFGVPFVDVVKPASEKAAVTAENGRGRVIVLGTAATVRSGAYERAVAALDPKIELRSVACPMFVPLVENGYTSGRAARLFVDEYLKPLASFGADAVILGCTHYPHLAPLIGEALKGSELVDSGREAVKAAAKLIAEGGAEDGEAEFYVSDASKSFETLASRFLKRGEGEGVRLADIIDIEKY